MFTSWLWWADWHLISVPTWRSSVLASIISVADSILHRFAHPVSWNASNCISQYQRSWLTRVLKHPWNPLISLAKDPLLIGTGAQTDAILWKMLSYWSIYVSASVICQPTGAQMSQANWLKQTQLSHFIYSLLVRFLFIFRVLDFVMDPKSSAVTDFSTKLLKLAMENRRNFGKYLVSFPG